MALSEASKKGELDKRIKRYNKGFKDGVSSYAISSEQLVIDTSDMCDNN